jgi:hypothetical protein
MYTHAAFFRFMIRDMETNTVLFEIAKPPGKGTILSSNGKDISTDCKNTFTILKLKHYFIVRPVKVANPYIFAEPES